MPRIVKKRNGKGGWDTVKTALPSEVEQRKVGLKANKPTTEAAKVETKKSTKAASDKE